MHFAWFAIVLRVTAGDDLLPLWECVETFWNHPAPAKMILGSMIYLQFHIVCDMSPDPWFTSKSDTKITTIQVSSNLKANDKAAPILYINISKNGWIMLNIQYSSHVIFQGNVPYLCHHKISIFRMPKFCHFKAAVPPGYIQPGSCCIKSFGPESDRSGNGDWGHWKLAVEILTVNSMEWFFRGKS